LAYNYTVYYVRITHRSNLRKWCQRVNAYPTKSGGHAIHSQTFLLTKINAKYGSSPLFFFPDFQLTFYDCVQALVLNTSQLRHKSWWRHILRHA